MGEASPCCQSLCRDSSATVLKYSWWGDSPRRTANGASPGASGPPVAPAVICHPDRQTEREIERGEAAGLSDRHANVTQSTRGKASSPS